MVGNEIPEGPREPEGTTMTNEETIEDLEKAVEKLTQRRVELDTAENRIPPGSDELRKRKRTLQTHSLEMLAHKNALQSIIRERKAASTPIPPLNEAQTSELKDALGDLNQVIKADQDFDAIVEIAKGVNGAAEKLGENSKIA
jgi:chromosome segregation ATPase